MRPDGSPRWSNTNWCHGDEAPASTSSAECQSSHVPRRSVTTRQPSPLTSRTREAFTPRGGTRAPPDDENGALRIVKVADTPRSETAGVARQMLESAKALESLGHEV